MIRLVASVLARRRPVGAIGVVVLVATLLVSAGAAAQQQDLPELTITVANGGVVNENVSTGKLVFTARLNKTWSADVTFGYSLDGDGQAEHEASLVEDFDYPGSSSEQVTITAGQRSATHRGRDHRRCPRRARRGRIRFRAGQPDERGTQR